MKLLPIILLLSIAASGQQVAKTWVTPAGWTAGVLEYRSPNIGSLPRKPAFIIYSHGNGEASDYNDAGALTAANGLLVNEIPKLLTGGTRFAFQEGGTGPERSFVVLSIARNTLQPPYQQSASEQYVDWALKYMRDSLANIVDTFRIYLVGISGGGAVGWKFPGRSLADAQKIAAIVQVAATPETVTWCNIASGNLPIWAFHATNDGTVGVSATVNAINAINACGISTAPIFTNPATGGHSIWGTYLDTNYVGSNGMNVYEWMLQYSRDPALIPTYPQDHQIWVNGSMIYDVTGAAHKPNQLFDGDTASLVFENNLNGYILNQTNGQLAWIVLDSFYTNMKVAAYKRNLNGGGGTVEFTFYYDWTDTTRHSNTYTATLADGQWKFADSVNSRAYSDSSRLVLMRIPSGASDKFSEVRIYGVASGAAGSIYPDAAADPPDQGKYFMGYNKVHTDNNLDDAGYSLRANTDHDYLDTTTSGPGGTWNGGFKYVLNRFANSIPLTYQPAKDSGRQVFLYTAGPRLNFKYPNLSNDSKDIPIGSDSTDINNWVYYYRTYYALVAKLGNNPSVDMSAYTFSSTTPGYGLGLISEIEGPNEAMGRWKDKGFHNPLVLSLAWKQVYDGAKAADPTIKVLSGAMTGIDTSWFKAMYICNLLRFHTKIMPLNNVAVNEYATNAGGQHQGASRGISPEEFQLYEKGVGLINVVRKHRPGAGVYLTEFGWDTHDGSSFVVPTIAGQTRDQTKANFELRAMDQAAAAGFSKYYHYTHKTIGGGDFGTTGISYDIFVQQAAKDTLPAIMQSVLTPAQWNGTNQWMTLPVDLYWYMTCRAYNLKNYKAKPTLQVKGDSTGLWRYQFDHVSDATKKMYSVAMGTVYNSTVSNYTFLVPGATSAKMYTPTVGNRLGTETNLSVVAGLITVPTVSETTQYIEVTINGSIIPPRNYIRGGGMRHGSKFRRG